MEKAIYLKRSLWGGVAIAAGLFGLSYAPLPDTATVLRGLAGVTLAGAVYVGFCRDTV